MASQTEAEIKLSLDLEKGWVVDLIRTDGHARRILASAPVDLDIVLMIANGIDQLIPHLTQNSERATAVTVVSTATHRVASVMGVEEREAAVRLAEIRSRREKFTSTLARAKPVATEP